MLIKLATLSLFVLSFGLTAQAYNVSYCRDLTGDYQQDKPVKVIFPIGQVKNSDAKCPKTITIGDNHYTVGDENDDFQDKEVILESKSRLFEQKSYFNRFGCFVIDTKKVTENTSKEPPGKRKYESTATTTWCLKNGVLAEKILTRLNGKSFTEVRTAKSVSRDAATKWYNGRAR